jgi:hypothetical protein
MLLFKEKRKAVPYITAVFDISIFPNTLNITSVKYSKIL